MSTPATRLAARDYWTSAPVAKWCQRLDYTLALAAVTALLLLGSMFN